MNTNTHQKRIMYYVVLLSIISFAAYYISSQFKGSPIASVIIMSSPALAAFIASALTGRSLKEIGWRVTPIRWLGIGWILPILYAIPAYALVWITGLGDVPSPTFLERARLTLNMPSSSDGLVIVTAFFYITVINLLPSLILSLGEEIGWRGFLVPELTQWIGFRNASLFSGILWASWHLPGFLAGEYGAIGTPKAYQFACFTLMVITTGIVMAWLRMKSGSIIPVAIMHATHNGIIQVFLDRITADTGITSYFTGEFGIALIFFTLAMALYFWRKPITGEVRALAFVGDGKDVS